MKTFEDEFLYFLLLWINVLCLFNAQPHHHSFLTSIWMDVLCFAKHFLAFIHLHIFVSPPLYLLLQPYLSVMLNKGSLEVLMYTGSHSLRRVVRRLDQGVLNDGREHSLRIERLPGRLCACLCLQQSRTTVLSDPGMVFLSLSGLLLFRWTRRPRGRLHFPTISPWTCTDSSSVVFLQRWSRRPTESTSHSRDAYGTWWLTLCT